MWVLKLDRGRVTVLGRFEGYVYSVPAATNRGYRDIVVGRHGSAFEAGLTYFRFDGVQYQTLSYATATRDDGGKEIIVPEK